MRRKATTACTLVLIFCVALPLAAAEPTTPSPAAPQPIPNLPENQAEIAAQAAGQLVLEPAPAAAPAPAAVVAPSAEMLEIGQAVAAERARVAELSARLRGLTDDASALALQREIEQAKRETEIGILRIQAKHARLAGREAQAVAIEADIARMLAPTPALPASPSGDAAR